MSFILEIRFPNPSSGDAQSIVGEMEDDLPPIGYEYLLSMPQMSSEEPRSLFQASLKPSKPPYQEALWVKVTRVIKFVNLEKQVIERRVIAETNLGYSQYWRLTNRLHPDYGWKLSGQPKPNYHFELS